MRPFATVLAVGALLAMGATGLAVAGDGHTGAGHGAVAMPHDIDEAHREHQHGRDFEVMEPMTADQQAQAVEKLQVIGVVMPLMDAERGRYLFVEKGCIVCHSVGGVGGGHGPALNAADLPRPLNVFAFAARMWRSAQVMAALQEDMLGEVIALDGQDLADLIAFAHDAEEQARLTHDQIPVHFHRLIGE